MITVGWRARAVPLDPLAVVGTGLVATALLECAEGLRGVRTSDAVVLVGDDLPWVDGCRYLGRDPAAPGVYLPTELEPDVPVALFAAALQRRHAGPVAVWPGVAVSLLKLRPVVAGWTP